MKAPRLRITYLAWGLASVDLLLFGGAIVLSVLIGSAVVPGHTNLSLVQGVGSAFLIGSFSGIGALIASRRSENPIGWLFLAVALSLCLNDAADGYSVYGGVIAPGALPGPAYVKWFANLTSAGGFAALALLLAVFPNGRLVSPRWKWLLYVIAAALLLGVSTGAVHPGSLGGLPLDNPFGLSEAAAAIDALANIVPALLVLGYFGGVASIIVRLRRSHGSERQQLKWFVYSASIAVVMLFAAILSPEDLSDAAWSVALPSLGLIPLATAMSVLRYRLYDIDVLIRRTLIYAGVSAVLLVAYVGGVALFQTLLAPFTAGSGIAVAASTLAAVALFQPVRSRIQRTVDRRFYRSKYDADRTLDAFAARLREQIDLGALEGELLAVVDETLQPARASVWLRR